MSAYIQQDVAIFTIGSMNMAVKENARFFSYAEKRIMQAPVSGTTRHGIRKPEFRSNGSEGQDITPTPTHRRR
jgi:hypothetical protein